MEHLNIQEKRLLHDIQQQQQQQQQTEEEEITTNGVF
jgi:heme exporter protein D